MDFINRLATEFKLRPQQVQAAVELLDAGNTIPFIARYRKEATGSLDDQVLREMAERLEYLRNLEKRREEIAASLEEQGVMNDELQATRHYFLSLRRVYRLVINVVVGLVLFLLACLVLHLVHRHKVKKGHPPYSKWYVIAPYLTSIAAMTVLTAMLTYHLFAIDAVRIVCGSFTMLAIFLLSLRGTLRYKRKSSILLTTFLFVLFAVTFLFFDRTAKLPFSWVKLAAPLYFSAMDLI